MTIYLYVKTHRKTGLKYLGKTKSKNPHKYQGSGTYWLRHLKAHGNHVDTVILHECKTNEEIKKWGTYYSELWNVVESSNWANLKKETGDGADSEFMREKWESDDYREKIAATWDYTKRKKQADRLLEQYKDPIFIEKQRASQNTEEQKKVRSQTMSKQWEDPKFAEIVTQAAYKQWENKEFRQMMSECVGKWATEMWRDPKHRQNVIDKISGKNNYRYDHTKYNFIHTNGIEEYCTSYELHEKYPEVNTQTIRSIIKGRRKSHKGWRIRI